MSTWCHNRSADRANLRWACVVLSAVVLAAGCGNTELARSTSSERSQTHTACEGIGAEEQPAKALTRCLMPSVAFVETSAASGSGTVVEIEGEKYILTNLHVVAPEPSARVMLPGEQPEDLPDVEVRGVDKLTDIALLGPIETDRLPVRLEDPGVEKGDQVFLIGYPGEMEENPEPTITSGIVSRLRTNHEFGLEYIQTDASIAGGQSGGALADAEGDVIGVSGLGFAEEFALVIDATEVREAIERILGPDADEYTTLPPREGVPAATSGTATIADTYVSELMYLAGDDDGVTLDLSVTSDAAPASISVDDYETGENLFFDRSGLSSYFGIEADASADEIDGIVDDFDLVIGDPVSPGHWIVQIPPGVDATVELGITEDRPTNLTWTASPGLDVVKDDVVDRPIQVGETVEDQLDYLESSATFTVDLEAGATYLVTVASNENDPEVTIIGPGESYEDGWLATDSGGIYGFDVDEEFTPEESGQHQIVLENYAGASMVYRLQIDKV